MNRPDSLREAGFAPPCEFQTAVRIRHGKDVRAVCLSRENSDLQGNQPHRGEIFELKDWPRRVLKKPIQSTARQVVLLGIAHNAISFFRHQLA